VCVCGCVRVRVRVSYKGGNVEAVLASTSCRHLHTLMSASSAGGGVQLHLATTSRTHKRRLRLQEARSNAGEDEYMQRIIVEG
jgi:hypothetical protein